MIRILLLLILLHLTLVLTYDSKIAELIERVYNESDSATVYFIRFDKEFLSKFLREHSEVPATIIDEHTVDLKNITKAILVIEALESQDTLDDIVLRLLIARLEVRKFLIISSDSLDNLKHYFDFFFRNYKFTRTLGTVGDISYAFFPFAHNQVQKLSKSGFLPHPLKDLNGFTFRTVIQKDIPRTFPYTNKNGQQQVGGCFGQLLVNFIKNHNATYRDIFLNNSSALNIPAAINATRDNMIDISMNAHPQSMLDKSYPVKVLPFVMMVPIQGYVNPNEYFKRPFRLSAWICIGFALVYITLMKVLLNKCRRKPANVWESFSSTFPLMLMLSPEKAITSAYRLHIQVFLFTFIIGNIYVIFFTSFLTAFIRIKQFDTIEDIIDNKFPVLVSKNDYKHLSRKDGYPKQFIELYVVVDHDVYYKELNSMKNTSYAYILGQDRRDYLLDMQASLQKPLFRKALQEFGFYFVNYFLAWHSPFKEILDDFVVRVKETGLMSKWDADVIPQAGMAGFQMEVDRLAGEKPLHVPLTLHHLEFAWNCLVFGWIIALVGFLGERVAENFGF